MTEEAGIHYLAVIIDTGSRRITGWTFDSRYGTELALGALGMATDRNTIQPGAVIDSDRGTQYSSKAWAEQPKSAD